MTRGSRVVVVVALALLAACGTGPDDGAPAGVTVDGSTAEAGHLRVEGRSKASYVVEGLLLLAPDGSYSGRRTAPADAGGDCRRAFDSASAVLVQVCAGTAPGGGAQRAIATGMAVGFIGGDEATKWQDVGPQGGPLARALAERDGTTSEAGTATVDVEMPLGRQLSVTVDMATGIPVRSGGDYRATVTAVPAPLDPAGEVEKLKAEPVEVEETQDLGFRVVELAGVEGLVPYEPHHLGSRTESGFVLERVYFGESLDNVPRVAGNPKSTSVVVYLYRRGFDRIVVTNRDATGSASWSDPFRPSPSRLPQKAAPRPTVFGGAVGPFAPLSGFYGLPVYTWGIVGGAVVTVEGYSRLGDLRAAVSELARSS